MQQVLVHRIGPNRATRAAIALAVIALVLVGAASGQARDTLSVCPAGPPKCEFRTIQEALAVAENGDRIRIAPGTYSGGFTIAKDVRLIGSGPQLTTIDSRQATPGPAPVVTVEAGTTTTIKGVTITGGLTWNSTRGSAIHNEGALKLEGSTVSMNTGLGPETVAIFTTGTLALDRSAVSDNECGAVGGIWNEGGTLTVSRSTITDNDSAGGAGAILNDGGTATVAGSTISGNRAERGGGGIQNWGALTVTRSTLERNTTPEGAGGGIDNKGTATVTETTVNDNLAGPGGGIANSGMLTLRRALVDGNRTNFNITGSDGGGIENWGTAIIIESTISRNTAWPNPHHFASAAGLDNNGVAVLFHVLVSGNMADAQGGGIRNAGTLTLDHSTVTGNTARDLGGTGVFGGGVHNDQGALSLRHATVRGNTPDDCVGC